MNLRPLLPLLLLSACTVGPDYVPPKPKGAAGAWIEPATPGAVDLAWWDRFGDAQLSALVQRAIASAPDIREAEARIAEARADRDAAAGGKLPTVSASAAANENVISETGLLPIGKLPGVAREFPLYDLGFDASWELDLWGRNRRQVQAAGARLEAADYAKRDVMLTLIGELVRSYLDLRAAQADRHTLQAQAASDAELARLTHMRFDHGEATQIDLANAEGAARTSAGAVPDADARAAAAAYRIATLLGAPPEDVVPALKADAPLPASPDTILTGVRSELLERRPDVRHAERELAAATADIGVATADLFPRFSLVGSLGQQSRTVTDLFSSASTRLQVGPSISWPIFSAGTIRAQIHSADARADAAAVEYEKAVATALSDSESAINRFLNARTTAEESAVALDRAKASFALAERRAQQGEDDRLALERARQGMLAAGRRADQANAAKATAAAALYKALGGGWS
jgi:NodT family efflux transporter outer membrane factor (OMF) lipoprotein